jgi:hypothetical protein
MRLPKLPGFKNRNKVEYEVVNVSRLEMLFADGDTVDCDALVAKGVIKSAPLPSRSSAMVSSPRSSRSRSTRSRPRQVQDRSCGRDGRGTVLTAIANAFRVPELRRKILFTLTIIGLYRVGSFIPAPGVDTDVIQAAVGDQATLGLLNLFSGGALEQFAVFSLGIMPYITSSIIMQLLQGVIPTVERWAKEGEAGSARSRRSRAT